MKVIRVDNFDRASVSDVLIMERLSPEMAKRLADALQRVSAPDEFFRAVEDDYILYQHDP